MQQYLSVTNHIITPYVWFINQAFYDSLTAEEQAIVDWAAKVAVDAGRGISRIIEASALPQLAAKMEVNAVPVAEMEKFAAATQPAVRELIEEQYGEEGMAMLNAMLSAIEAARGD